MCVIVRSHSKASQMKVAYILQTGMPWVTFIILENSLFQLITVKPKQAKHIRVCTLIYKNELKMTDGFFTISHEWLRNRDDNP